ncbi:FecR family protein [Aquimarina amphilecti]|uniref:FecR family protein n=1 Tax=Aquimarina amphilecti TaxID=1038014 RepID=A0A1H7UH04_AQUAM|nr:FecR family protein [Aquimarina amphilecti]SEL96313.1 FecR family protein [Aquimarina amphilecti]
MKNPYSDETFLARWLNNDLNDRERTEFEKSDDYQKYITILNKIEKLESPDYNKKKVFNIIRSEIQEKSKVRTFIPKWTYGIAATLLVLIGFFFFFDNSTSYSTDYGEQISFKLLDGSEVVLNSKSELKFKKSNWNNDRKVKLVGEAFFKVKKGSDFVVETESGRVKVLGTQFNVNTQKDFFEVTCVEGKVKAMDNYASNEAILTKGKAFRIANNIVENWETETAEPGWISGETTFTNTPLKQVIHSLENQFNLTFDKKNIDQNMRFTGSYNHTDIKLALKTIFVPMEISYTFNNENHIVLVKE